MIARIAVGLAWSSLPEHRWRRVAVPLAATVFMVLVLLAISLLLMVRREEGRQQRRMAVLAATPAPTDLWLVGRGDEWRGEQFPVIWIEPTGSTLPVLPPGMTQFPAPGQAVVSPALDRLAQQQPSVAARYPTRLVLSSEGIRSEDELFAYIRMPAGRTLANDDRTMRVQAFGESGGTEPSFDLSFIAPIPINALVASLLALLVVPGMVVLVVGVATASGVRDHRFEVLHWVGAPTRWRVALGVVETLMLALPGLALATIVWAIIAPQLTYVPLVGHAIVDGDLGIPWGGLLTTFAVCVGLTAFVATLVTAMRSWVRTVRPRPVMQRATVNPMRIIPFGIGLILIWFSRIVGGAPTLNDTVLIVGILIMLVAVPLMLPVVLRIIGTWLHQQASAAALVAGRTLDWDALRTARPFASIATLITLSLIGSLYIAVLRQLYTSSLPSTETQVVNVRWFDPHTDDVTRLAGRLPSSLVVPIAYTEDSNTLRAGSTCQQLSRFISEGACRSEAPFELSNNMKQRLSELAGDASVQVQLVDSNVLSTSGDVLVFDNASLDVLHERVQVAAMQTLPVPTITNSLSFVLSEPWQNAWIFGGMLTGALALSIGCLIAMIDRLLVTRKHRQHLINLGLSFRKLVVIEMLLFATPYLISIVLGLTVGIAMSVLSTYGTDIQVPWDLISTTFMLSLIAGVISMVGVALFGARSALISRT